MEGGRERAFQIEFFDNLYFLINGSIYLCGEEAMLLLKKPNEWGSDGRLGSSPDREMRRNAVMQYILMLVTHYTDLCCIW